MKRGFKSSAAAVSVMLAVVLFVSSGYGQNVSTLPAPKPTAQSQTSASNDPVIRKIWVEGRDKSQLYSFAQELLDSIGPRLTGSTEQKLANDWAVALYRKWGIPVRAEQYGTWMGWRRGIPHIDLIEPRVRSLEGMLSTWSRGTKGTVEGPVVLFPKVQTAAEFEASLLQVRGKFVLFSFPWPTCRPDATWKEFATPESFMRMQKERTEAFEAWYTGRVRKSGLRGRALVRRLEEAGALGIVTVLVPPPGPQGRPAGGAPTPGQPAPSPKPLPPGGPKRH